MAWGDLRRLRLACLALCCAVAATMLVPATAPGAASGAKASIIRGAAASISQFPSLAFVVAIDDGNALSCTGTVIAPRVVLTAGHCVEDLDSGGFIPAAHFRVVTGFANPSLATSEQRSKVTSTHVSPQYNPGTGRGDAGILILAAPVAAPPIALATAADAALYEGGAGVDLAGWGLTRFNANAAPETLQATSTVVLDPATCKKRTRPYHPTYSTAAQMCASSPPTFKTGGCFGDSGGPAIAHRADGSAVEIGVISTGGPRCSTKLPNIFTRTDLVSLWAGQWIGATEAGAPPPSAKPRLPSLRTNDAVEFVEGALATVFRERFLRGEILAGGCRRLSKTRVKCELAWRTGGTLFYGSVSVFYVVRSDAVVWDRTYRISSTNYRCRVRGDRPESCPVRSYRG